MKQYEFGINTYYRTATLFIDEGHWYLFAIEKLGELAFEPFSWGWLPTKLECLISEILINKIMRWTNKYKKHTCMSVDYYDLINKTPEYKVFHDEAMSEDPPHIFEKYIIVEKLPIDNGYDGGWILKDPVFDIEVRGTNCNINREKLKQKVLTHISGK